MKNTIIIYLILFASNYTYSQTVKSEIDWAYLIGKWECEKVVLSKGKVLIDKSEEYKPYFCYYYSDLKYRDEYPNTGAYTTEDGKYKVNKTNNIISYTDYVSTTKYSGGKVAVPDNVFKWSKQQLIVVKLERDKLVLVQKYIPNTELQGDYTFYMKKVK